MWPDALPANIVVPEGFTLYYPGDLDLSNTDVIVRGTLVMSVVSEPSPVAASETVAGLVELATQAEVDAGTDAQRTVTPATLANWAGLPPAAAFDDVVFTFAGTGMSSGVAVSVEPTLGGEPAASGTLLRLYGNPTGSTKYGHYSGGTSYSEIGYLSGDQFSEYAAFSNDGGGLQPTGFEGRLGATGRVMFRAYDNPTPFGSINFSVVVVRPDGEIFASDTFVLPQGE